MRHKAAGPHVDFRHRLARAAAHRLDRAAERLPVRALVTVMVAMSLGIGGYVALSSVMGGSSTGRSDSAVDTALPGAERPHQPDQAPAPDGGGGPAPGASPSGQPQTPPTTSDGTRSTSPSTDPGEAKASPSTDTPTPSTSPSQPSPDAARTSRDDAPPNTSLSEEFPASDTALFRLSASEGATFTCSLDGAAYSACDSPTRYSDLEPGWHTFAVRAVASDGNADPSPAGTRWLANNGHSGDE